MKNKPHLIMFCVFSITLIGIVISASCKQAVVSSDNKKPCGKTIDLEAFEAKVEIDTTNISEEGIYYYEQVYNQ